MTQRPSILSVTKQAFGLTLQKHVWTAPLAWGLIVLVTLQIFLVTSLELQATHPPSGYLSPTEFTLKSILVVVFGLLGGFWGLLLNAKVSRLVVLDEPLSFIGSLSIFLKLGLKMLLWSIVISVPIFGITTLFIGIALAIAIPVLMLSSNTIIVSLLAFILVLVGLVPGLWLMIRWAFVLPSVAVTGTPQIGKSWRQTKGHVIAMTTSAYGLVFLPFIIVIGIFQPHLWVDAASPSFVVFLVSIPSGIASILSGIAFSAAVAVYYRALSE